MTAPEKALEGPENAAATLRRCCPSCHGVGLAMDHRKGVSIDSCPRCGGIWLDAGELERLLARAVPAAAGTKTPSEANAVPFAGSALHARRRRSWLEDVFA